MNNANLPTLEFILKNYKNFNARATRDGDALKWVQAENRVSPDQVVAQTGFMQGAAGVGTVLLHLDAAERGRNWDVTFPDSPWA